MIELEFGSVVCKEGKLKYPETNQLSTAEMMILTITALTASALAEHNTYL